MDFLIDENYSGALLRDYLKIELGLSSRTLSALKNNERGIVLNGRRVTVRAPLSEGDVLSLALEDREEDENTDLVPADIPIDILYEDGDCVAVDKPTGMATHPSYNHRGDTLANALAYYFSKQGKPFVFRAVNRLDLESSGAVLVAKNRSAAYKLNRDMQCGKIKKEYTAILTGSLEPSSGRIESYISRLTEGVVIRCSRPDGKPSEYALTEYETLGTSNGHSLVKAVPITGRTHQLRVHFSSKGAPILGDGMYGSDSVLIGRTALHSGILVFETVSGNRTVTVSSPLPDDIKTAWEKIKCPMK